MSADQDIFAPSRVQTFEVSNDAPEAPRVSRAGSVPIDPQPHEIADAQMQQIGARQNADAPQAEQEQAEPVVEPITAPLPEEDIQRLLPDPNLPFALDDGTLVVARHLRLREFLAMMKIVTRGASIALGTVPLNLNDENFSQNLISLFIFAIPEAEDEAVDFIGKIVDPAAPSGGFPTAEAEVAARTKLEATLENPDFTDVITIIETVIRKEGPDLRKLGKRLTDAMAFAQRTGQAS